LEFEMEAGSAPKADTDKKADVRIEKIDES
jgi:hypothetical protein